MFILNLTYKVVLEEVEKHLEAHIVFLNQQYEEGNFLMSGRKVPRTGGIILTKKMEKNELLKIIEKDPFYSHQLANYEIIEFMPTKSSTELEFLIE